MWLLLAKDGGCPIGTKLLEGPIARGNAADLEKGQSLANEWLRTHAPRDAHLHAEDTTDGCRLTIGILEHLGRGANV